MNTIIAIGFMGNKRCYLNVAEDEAIKRYREEFGYDDYTVETISFEDSFIVYDIWVD